jgi:hypothetical protein
VRSRRWTWDVVAVRVVSVNNLGFASGQAITVHPLVNWLERA